VGAARVGAVPGRLLSRLATAVLPALVLLVVVHLAFIRPWALRWGAADEEAARAMKGDWIVPNPASNATRAVEIDARPDQIWPWIVQMGVGRAGFYSYDWIDNNGTASADRIIPEYQDPQAGDLIPTSLDGRRGFRIKGFEPGRYMLWIATGARSTRCWQLDRTGSGRTRLVTRVRSRYPSSLPGVVRTLLAEAGDLIMTRKCMLGIKARAEALARREATAGTTAPGQVRTRTR
jgi:hypothetical protein